MIVHNEDTRVFAVHEVGKLDLSKKWEVTIKKYRTDKTAAQLRLYWKWVQIIADEFGYFKDEMSEYLKEELIEPDFVTVKGKTRSVRPSVSKMKIDEMAAYMNKVSMWAGTHGINLPFPEEMHDGN